MKNGFIDQGKYKEKFSERKWTDREYHVQDNDNVAQKDVKIYCNTNKFPELPFCGTHAKPHGTRGLINSYHFGFDPKLGSGVCKIIRTMCICCIYIHYAIQIGRA